MKKIMVAVTGMSPQIVTETIYALHTKHQWTPNQIIVLTTLAGRKKIIDELLGENGYFTRLCRDYELSNITFDAADIKVITENGIELDDIRTPEQNNAAADMIVREIYDLCANEDTELHVSIAGGRKSMGFYVGYALSLFGRQRDKLSHVLVEEAFEQNREFFYPPKEKQLLNINNRGMMDASQAEVMLAEIPFVRMGKPQFNLGKNLTFLQAVELAQLSVHENRVVIDAKKREIICNDLVHIKLSPTQFALYLSMAQFRQEGIEIDFSEAKSEVLLARYWQHYQRYGVGLQGQGKEATKNRKESKEKLDNKKDEDGVITEMPIFRILQENKSHIGKALQKKLGDYGQFFEIASVGKNTKRSYHLALEPEQINIIGLES